jgi:hypothetical protein
VRTKKKLRPEQQRAKPVKAIEEVLIRIGWNEEQRFIDMAADTVTHLERQPYT